MVVMETCISGSRASEILRTLPYDGIHTIDLVDYARGIWLLWRGDMVDMDVLTAMEQEILAIVKVLSSPSPWLLSSIYGSPRFEERQILWDNLCSVSLLHDLPWTIVGDYDDVIDGTEKLGGKPEVIDKGDSKLKKLRSVCGEEVYKTVVDALLELNDYNSSGRTLLFPNANVTHFPRVSSDHCPLLLRLFENGQRRLERSIRFEKMWLNHPGFQQVVEKAWEFMPSLGLAISTFKNLASTWNKEIFGNIFARKRQLLPRIRGLQKALAAQPSAFLISLEQELSLEYASLLNQEEDFWALKSRVDWQLFGDRNTAFYHTKTIIKRKHNQIRRIMNQSGEWIEDEDQVMDIVLSVFKVLYQTQHLTFISTADFEIK
nr:uncharacterized protein LOC112006928 [Quercus suber]